MLKKYPSGLGKNCVTYAGTRSDLPVGLSTLNQKLAKINSHTPSPGKIGVTREGPVGHLVVVEEVRGDNVIISEGNYIHGYISWREIPKQKVLGYF